MKIEDYIHFLLCDNQTPYLLNFIGIGAVVLLVSAVILTRSEIRDEQNNGQSVSTLGTFLRMPSLWCGILLSLLWATVTQILT